MEVAGKEEELEGEDSDGEKEKEDEKMEVEVGDTSNPLQEFKAKIDDILSDEAFLNKRSSKLSL